MKQILIVGGGISSYFSALYLKNKDKKLKITIIDQNPYIHPIIGSTLSPQILEFLEKIDISKYDLFKSASSTVLLGNRYTNWRTKGRVFKPYFYITHDKNMISNQDNLETLLTIDGLDSNGPLINLPSILSEYKASPFIKNNSFNDPNNPLEYYENLCSYALSVDPVRFKSLLKTKSLQLGIKIVDSFVHKIENNTVYIDDVTGFSGDLLIDTTDFSRLFIDIYSKNSWKNEESHSLVDTMLFFKMPIHLKSNESSYLNSYTEIITTDYGWILLLPVQGEYHCVYSFNKNTSSIEDIKNHIKKLFNDENDLINIDTSSKVLDCNFGYYKESFINNCLSLGPASGFLDILFDKTLDLIKLSLDNLSLNKNYNSFIEKKYVEMSSFNSFCYLGSELQSNFWLKKDEKITLSSFILELLNKWTKKPPEYKDFESDLYDPLDWIQLAFGLDLLNTPLIKETIKVNKKHVTLIKSTLDSAHILADHAVPNLKFLWYVSK